MRQGKRKHRGQAPRVKAETFPVTVRYTTKVTASNTNPMVRQYALKLAKGDVYRLERIDFDTVVVHNPKE